MANALDLRASELKLSHGEYLRWLTSGRPTQELAALAETLTINETYFFRHSDQFNALAEVEAFSGSVSHDLRGPLQVISSYTETLLDEDEAGLLSDTSPSQCTTISPLQ